MTTKVNAAEIIPIPRYATAVNPPANIKMGIPDQVKPPIITAPAARYNYGQIIDVIFLATVDAMKITNGPAGVVNIGSSVPIACSLDIAPVNP